MLKLDLKFKIWNFLWIANLSISSSFVKIFRIKYLTKSLFWGKEENVWIHQTQARLQKQGHVNIPKMKWFYISLKQVKSDVGWGEEVA